jgi:hypothetical protein
MRKSLTKKMTIGMILAGVLSCGITNAASPSVEAKPDESIAIEFIGKVEFAGNDVDLSGLTSGLEDQSPSNRLGGFSAIEYTGKGNRFAVLADRGAGDGAVSFPCRMQVVDLHVERERKTIQADWVSTVLLHAIDGVQLDGSKTTAIADRSRTANQAWHAMDPEGIRRWGDGWLISDEYGPNIGCFNFDGQLKTQWQLPESRGRCKMSEAELLKNDQSSNRAVGCFDNKGLEGLAVTPSGSTVWASYQSSLLQDGELIDGRCRGDFTRWIAFDRDGKRKAEVAYPMASRRSGISELLAMDENRMLVLERDGKAGEKAKIKRIYLADLRDASEVSKVESLPLHKSDNLTQADPIEPVRKRLLIDLMDLQDELGDAATAEKPEGLTWGPPLDDGRRTLWVCWDNDFDPSRKSYIACFAIN